MLATPSPVTVCKSHHEIWCRSVILSVSSPNEPKSRAFPPKAIQISIAASLSVPWIYLGQFWHTLKEDGSNYRLKFVLERKELTLTLDDFRRIFQLPQAIYNNHERFVAAPKFLEMVSFFLNDLGITLELRSPSNFMTTGLVQPWQTLGYMFARCLTTRATGMINRLCRSCKCYTVLSIMTPKSLRTPNPDVNEGESSAQQKSTVIRLRIPPRRSNRLTSPTPIPTAVKVEDMIVQDTIQLIIAEQKSHDDLEAEQNV
ncbi:hypothetical protein Tco_0035495 [Tanacetum coccineum]